MSVQNFSSLGAWEVGELVMSEGFAFYRYKKRNANKTDVFNLFYSFWLGL
jgi:hypothetical protein